MLEVYFSCMWGFASHLVGFIRMLHAVYTQKTNMLEYLKSDTFLIIEMDKRVNFSDDKNTKSSILSIWPYNWRFRTVYNWHFRTVTLTLNQGVYPSCAQLMFFFSFLHCFLFSCVSLLSVSFKKFIPFFLLGYFSKEYVYNPEILFWLVLKCP